LLGEQAIVAYQVSRGTPPTAVDVAIVNWNTSEAALAAVAAYLASEGAEPRVKVVDNASSGEQRRLLEKGCPAAVELEMSEENLGYGAAASRALRDGQSEVVCISNADVLPDPRALARLAAVALREPQAGMVGPVFGGDTDRYHAKLPGSVAMLGRIFAGSFMRGAAPSPNPGEISEVGQPSGACFVVRRETWEKIGGFDEGFFLWYEDVDLAKRLHDASYRNLVVGSARVGHVGAESFRQIDQRRLQAIRLASVRRYIAKHHRAAAPIAAPLLRVATWARADGKQE
jgi:N-acetylglucosaminyl-diphospho-decaprenol L-rhamnosyltransferase